MVNVGVNFYWKRLKAVFDRFMSWQDDPQSYSREIKAYFEDFEL